MFGCFKRRVWDAYAGMASPLGGPQAYLQQNYLSQHPDHHVIKSDIKSYYASIDHTVLNEQFQHLLPHEPILHSLLWNFMRRTVEFGGNYREVERGLPLGASLSPLLGALYLSPLDELAKQTPDTFYRRYMDDWVWIFPKKHTLRDTMKKQYGILQALRVAMHPDKTFIGKVAKGFDFLGFHLSPTGVTVSEAALSRHEQKVSRLYEQGASAKRIRGYRLRWLAWAAGALYAGGGPVAFGAMSTSVSDQRTLWPCITSSEAYVDYCGVNYGYMSGVYPQARGWYDDGSFCQSGQDLNADAQSGGADGLLSDTNLIPGAYGQRNSNNNFLASTPTVCLRKHTANANGSPLAEGNDDYFMAVFPPPC